MSKYISAFISLLVIGTFLIKPVFAYEFKIASPPKPPSFSTKESVDEVVVKFKPWATQNQKDALNQLYKTQLTKSRRFADFVTLKTPRGISSNIFAQRLGLYSFIEYAEPNYIAYALMTPNDTYYPYQWNFDNLVNGGIEMQDAWDMTTGAGVTVAVVDTGVAYENYRQNWFNRYEQAPDLSNTCFSPGYDFVNNDTHPNDDQGHGTHVAGTIAQTTNNNEGVAGVSFSSCVMPVKVLNSQGSGTYADIAEGIRFAADNGAKVINLSLGGGSNSSALRDAVSYAYNKGVLIVAALGNNGSSQALYPAAYDQYVIGVGATRFDQTLAYYSNYGTSVDLVAPGGDLNVDQNNDGYADGILQQTFGNNTSDWGYWFYQGTSMASPHVAGVAALVISKKDLTPGNVKSILESSAKDLGDQGRDNTYGWGLVNATAALNLVSNTEQQASPTATPTPTNTPTLTPTPTNNPEPGEFLIDITSHTASARWSNFRGGRIDFTIKFNVTSGSSNNVVVKEIPDNIGNWGLYRGRTQVDVYINGKRYRTNFTWDQTANTALVDIGALEVLLTQGDQVEIRNLRLANDTRGNHYSDGNIYLNTTMLEQNRVQFSF